MGTEWGARFRSQIFFVAFWLSLIGLILFCDAMACLSTDSYSIKSMPFFEGSLKIVENNVTTSVDYYAGIARMVFRSCDGDQSCPPESLGWGDDSCDKYFANCNQCRDAPAKVSFPIVMSLLGQIGQIATDLNRSTGESAITKSNSPSALILTSTIFLLFIYSVKYDLHCQKL